VENTEFCATNKKWLQASIYCRIISRLKMENYVINMWSGFQNGFSKCMKTKNKFAFFFTRNLWHGENNEQSETN
jgi:hypothetical protein